MAPSNETIQSLRILREEKDKIDRQILELQARSKAYDTAIKAVEAESRRPSEPVKEQKPAVDSRGSQEPVKEKRNPAESIAELFAAAVKDKPGATAPTAADVQNDLQANKHASPTSFVVPNDSSNAPPPIVEASIVRSYGSQGEKNDVVPAEKLVGLRSVLAGLAATEYKGNRAHIWPRDYKQFAPIKGTADRTLSEALNTVTGESMIGFDIAVLRVDASNDGKGGQPGFLYLIDDKLREKLFVMGPSSIDADLTKALAKNGVTYMPQSAQDATTEANEFLAEGAKYRGNIGRLLTGHTQSVIESMIQACYMLFDAGPPIVPKGTTVGMTLKQAQNPRVYSSIVKPVA